MGPELRLPDHYDPRRVGEVWPVPYERRAREARAWAAAHGLQPACEDRFRVALLAIDLQNTFCTPSFELFVAGRSGQGAVEDSRRLCAFVYRNLARLTRIFVTLDTHQPMQIFHAIFFTDEQGESPPPYTQISAEDVERGRWRPRPEVALALGMDEEAALGHLRHYTRKLAGTGKYQLTVWPYHALLGGIGHALVSAVEEAFFFHAIARTSQPWLEIKGRSPWTEHYSVLGPEVSEDARGNPIGERNVALLEALLEHDAIIVAGQAKSHCVAWTVEDLLADPRVQERGFAGRVYLLEDCTSPVVVPGVVDFTEQAEATFRRFAALGAHVVRSTQPMDAWPGVIGEQAGRVAKARGGSKAPARGGGRGGETSAG